MSSRSLSSRSLFTAAVAVVSGALLFAGCASDAGPAGDGAASAPGGASTATSEPGAMPGDIAATWLGGGRLVGIVTWGSSSSDCGVVAGEAAVQDDGSLAVTLEPTALTDDAGDAGDARVCTSDLVARVTLVDVPDGIDPGDGLDVSVRSEDVVDMPASAEVRLDPYAGPEVAVQSPSAGWIDDGLFAVLTWGSSSCAPVVESVEKTSATAVSVVFSSNGETACTDDLAARVVLAWVEGVDDDAAVTATLSGHEFPTPVTIPIS